MRLLTLVFLFVSPEINAKRWKGKWKQRAIRMEKMRPRYTGKNFNEHGLFEFVIENEEVRETLKNVNEKYQIDWLQSGI